MKQRILIAFLILTGAAILWASTRPAHAETSGDQRVASLSSTGHEEVHSVAFSPDGQLVAVGGTSGIYVFRAFDLSRAGFIQTGAWARSLAFVPGTNMLAAGLFDHTVKLWSVADARLARTLAGPADWVWSVSTSQDGSLLAAASGDDALRVWRTADGAPVLTLDKNVQGPRAVAVSPDGKLIAAGLEDKTVRVWRVADGVLLYTLSGHTDWVRCVAFSPDGSLLASGSFDTTIRLWNMEDGQLLRVLKGNTSSVLSVAFSPDGKTLASGSEDDARLWQVDGGNLLHVLEGHTSFVYSVAFSPDGQTLASGGADNTLRLWDLAQLQAEGPAPATEDVAPDAGPLDCRKCHHPRGQALPPRVTILRCEGCHAEGAGLEWCPGLARAGDATTLPIQYVPYVGQAGVPVGGDGVAVLIASPSNGETLYAKNGITAPAFITGQVYSGSHPVNQLRVELEVWSAGQKTAALTTTPSTAGQFKFNLGINPHGSIPYMIKPGGADCVPCHEDYRPQAEMPAGEVRIRVLVTDADDHQASDERWLRVDTSRQVLLPVKVVDDLTGKPLPGVSVNASTILYNWRDRFGNTNTGSDGQAQLDLESLSQVTTSYKVSVPPQSVNGVLCSSEPVEVQIQPGAEDPPAVTLRASVQTGRIDGKLSATVSNASQQGIDVWAVQLPAGPAYRTALDGDNEFSFSPIPVSQYALLPDIAALRAGSMSAQSQSVDLNASPHATLAIPITSTPVLSGKVLDENGKPLPFAWVQANGKGPVQPVDPTSGEYIFSAGTGFITVSAPGYYTRSQHLSPGQKVLDVQLAAESETRHLSWGSGQIVIPAQTDAEVHDLDISLNSGWVWGQGGASQSLIIRVPGAELSISGARFAVDDMVGQTKWLYLYDGKASVTFVDGSSVEVKGGQMLALQAHAVPFAMDETIGVALHPSLAEMPIPEAIRPSLTARLQNWLEKAGISSLQTITFITYFLSLVALITMPLFVLFSVHRRRRAAASQEKH